MPDIQVEELSKQLAVALSRLDDVRDDIKSFREEIQRSRTDGVSRGEWEQRNRAVDARFQELGREIGTLRTHFESKVSAIESKAQAGKAPWWAVAPVIASVVAILITLIEKIGA